MTKITTAGDHGSATNTVPTWDEYRRRLPEGLSDAALELIRRATAPERHAARVAAALHVAIDAARAAVERPCGAQLRALAWATLTADSIGIGGPLGASGLGTARVPPFRGLGKGRKNASDGDAWGAALVAASKALCADVAAAAGKAESCQFSVGYEEGEPELWVDSPEGGTRDAPTWRVPAELVPVEWVASIARVAILAHQEVFPWKSQAVCFDFEDTTLEEWGELLQATDEDAER